MARPRQYSTPAERQKAYRERKALEDVDPTLPERDIEEPVVPEPPAGARDIAVILATPKDTVLSEEEEQLVKDFYGYAPSETRTRAERSATATRIAEHIGPPPPEVEEIMRGLADEERRYLAKRKAYLEELERKQPPSPAKR